MIYQATRQYQITNSIMYMYSGRHACSYRLFNEFSTRCICKKTQKSVGRTKENTVKFIQWIPSSSTPFKGFNMCIHLSQWKRNSMLWEFVDVSVLNVKLFSFILEDKFCRFLFAHWMVPLETWNVSMALFYATTRCQEECNNVNLSGDAYRAPFTLIEVHLVLCVLME